MLAKVSREYRSGFELRIAGSGKEEAFRGWIGSVDGRRMPFVL